MKRCLLAYVTLSAVSSVLALSGRWLQADDAARSAFAKGVQPTRVLTNTIGMKFVLISTGEFMMGSTEPVESLTEAFKTFGAKPEHFADQLPVHRVRISKPYYLSTHEVTVGQFRQFVMMTGYKTEAERDNKGGRGYTGVGKDPWKQDPEFTWQNPGFSQTDAHPVVNVTWNDAVAFCEWLSRREGHTYRLPTEAEWEYACRAGTLSRYCHGDDPEGLAQVGNVVDAESKEKLGYTTIAARDGYAFLAPIGRFRPNAWGLYDMHGNAAEWCADWYGPNYYDQSPLEDPPGPANGDRRVCRGGSGFC